MSKLRGPVLFDETGLTREHIKSLRLIIYAIALGTVCFNITGGIAMTGYLKALGTSDFVFGILISVPPAAGTLQIFTSYVLERTKKRRAMFIVGGLVQRLLWLPFGLVPFFVPMSAPLVRIWSAALLLLIASVSNQFISIAYSSLLADIIPIGIRGRYLGTRGRVSTVMGIIGGFLTAWLLERFPGFNGYALVFGLAALLGSTDITLFFWIDFPPMTETVQRDSFWHMFREVLKSKQVLGLMAFFTIWNFTFNLSAPFHLVYIRINLGMSNTAITLIAQILPNICTVIILSRWGRMIDRHGIRPVILRVGRYTSIVYLLWVFVAPGMLSYVLVIVAYIARGLLFCGMEISGQTAVLNRFPERNRSMYMAIHHCVTTLMGTALANITGGWLLDNPLAALEGMNLSLFGFVLNRYNYLFLLTFILCVISAFVLLPRMVAPGDAPPAEGGAS